MTAGDRPLRPGEAAMTVEQVFDIAPLETGARVLTAFCSLVAVAGSVLFVFIGAAGAAPVILIGFPTFFLALIAWPMALGPTGYALGAADLAVTRRAARPLLFPLGSLTACRPATMPRRTLKRWASGGLFGFWGSFSNKEWGRFKAYANDRRHGVLLEWPGIKLFVSPEDPEAFCEAVLARGGRRRPPK